MSDTVIIHLPFPPSTNSLWRSYKRKVVRSAEYLAWQAKADSLVIYLGKPKARINDKFSAEIIIDSTERRRAGDLDNRIKSVLDWLQSREFIRNDRDLEELHVSWGEAPHGCRVVLRGCQIHEPPD